MVPYNSPKMASLILSDECVYWLNCYIIIFQLFRDLIFIVSLYYFDVDCYFLLSLTLLKYILTIKLQKKESCENKLFFSKWFTFFKILVPISYLAKHKCHYKAESLSYKSVHIFFCYFLLLKISSLFKERLVGEIFLIFFHMDFLYWFLLFWFL